jgi:hypothetical protein
MIRHLLPVLLLLLGAACGRVSEREARALVERYNQVVCDAYRRSDIQLIDSVVASEGTAGRNLTGLIGVRMDMGIILDAHLDELRITGVDQRRDGLQVRTQERWSYQDRRQGTGEQVGDASVDHYEMLYQFKKVKGAWLVTDTTFAAPPQVGRKATPWQMDVKDAHPMATAEAPKGVKP